MRESEPLNTGPLRALIEKHQLGGPAQKLDPESEAMLNNVLGITAEEANTALQAKLRQLADAE